MPKRTDGSGTIYLRGGIWWVKIRVDGRPVYRSSRSTKKSAAITLRDQLLAKRHRGELSGGAPDKVLINELLDDVLKSDIKEINPLHLAKGRRKEHPPVFGKLPSGPALNGPNGQSTGRSAKRKAGTDATVNRELSILRTAFHNASQAHAPPRSMSFRISR